MENIKEILREIEKAKHIKVLYACETGSRAWGFPSPDSDFDIRFIYMHDINWYLSLNRQKDTVDVMDGDMDITGWDLKKSLTLLKKSNAPLIERFNSPIEYAAVPGFREAFKELVNNYYSPIAVFFHHYAMANKFWEELKEAEEVKLKSLFYLIRSLLSCNWIINDNTVLPMHIDGLMIYTDGEMRARLCRLIELKRTVGEKYMHHIDVALNKWIAGMFEIIDESKNNLAVNKTDSEPLNEFFLKMLYAKVDY